jgi:hypothetical protein
VVSIRERYRDGVNCGEPQNVTAAARRYSGRTWHPRS